MTLRSKHIVPIVLVAFILGIGGTMVFNLWQTKSSRIPAAEPSLRWTQRINCDPSSMYQTCHCGVP